MKRQPWKERYAAHLRSPYWATLKQKVIARRGRKCEKCGCEDKPIEMHHKHYQTFGRERQKDVLLVCRDCHRTEDVERKKQGDARRLMARVNRGEYGATEFDTHQISDGELWVLMRGGIVDINTDAGLQYLGGMIDGWDWDASPEPGGKISDRREADKNDGFRAFVRAEYRRRIGDCVHQHS